MNMEDVMKRNQPYCSFHTDMPMHLQAKAKKLCHEYNQTTAEESKKRFEILQELFGTVHPMTFIEPSFRCDYGFNIHTHGLTIMNFNVVILDTAPVNIGANAFIGPGTCITCVNHALDFVQRNEGVMISKPIQIEEDVWIGANCTVCGGVTIGKGTVIGAGSVVTKDIPSGVVAVGNPCRVLRKITEADRIQIERAE